MILSVPFHVDIRDVNETPDPHWTGIARLARRPEGHDISPITIPGAVHGQIEAPLLDFIPVAHSGDTRLLKQIRSVMGDRRERRVGGVGLVC